MSYKASKNLKYFVVLVAAVLIVQSIIGAGSTAAALGNQTATQTQTTTTGGAIAERGKRPIVTLKKLKSPVAGANAALQIQFQNGERVEKRFTLTTGAGSSLVFADDGTGGDDVAGDGIFASPLQVDFDQVAANNDRILSVQKAANANLTTPRFNGRLRVGDTPMLASVGDSLTIDDGSGSGDPVATALSIIPGRSLLITDPSVIEDPTRTFNPCTGVGNPNGKWTFGYLMTQMANQAQTGIDPKVFVRNWLAKFENNQTINTFGIPARPKVKDIVTIPWELASGGIGQPLDLTKAPFRLLAIVNRIDLRGNSGYNISNAGEARFVFGVIDRRPTNVNCCNVTEMTVIFEYGIDRSGCANVKAWAQQWVNLSSPLIPFPSAQYNQALENITEQFAHAGVAPNKVNGSALNQLRTNEFLQPQPQWELREFKLTPGTEDPFVANGQLNMTTVKLTPDASFNNTGTLGAYLTANLPQVCAGTHVVPLSFAAQPFLGGSSFTAGPAGVAFWDTPTFLCPPNPTCDPEFNFSFNTCSGCHLSETGTTFYHIRPTPFGSPPILSPFLSGSPITINDPRCGAPFTHTFDEINRRRVILDQIANQICPLPCTTCDCITPFDAAKSAVLPCRIDVLSLSGSDILFTSTSEAVLRSGPGFVH